MKLLKRLRSSEMKAKALSASLAKEIVKDGKLLESLSEEFELLTDVEKGVVMEALEYATDIDPEVAEPVLQVVFDCLECEAPKVKWEAARIVGNIARRYPDRAALSTSRLLENAKHKGTVVRWSSAYALGEILRHNSKVRGRLLPEIDKALRREKNSGVKNVYLKALKAVR